MKVTKVGQFSGHQNSIYALQKGVKENMFYTGAGDGLIVEWNHEEIGDGQLLARTEKPIYSLFTDTNHTQLLAGTSSGNLHVIDLHSGKEIRNIEAHRGGIFDIKSFGNYYLTGGEDGKLQVWNEDLNLFKSLTLSEKSTRIIAIHPDGKSIAVGNSDHKIRIYNTEFECVELFDDHTNSVFALQFSNDGQFLFSGGRDAKLHMRDVKNHFVLLQDIPAHTLHINHISINPSGNLLATASMDKTVKIWDAVSLQLLKVIDKQKFDGHLSSVNKILWLNHTQLLSSSDDRTVMKWEIEM